MTEAMVPSNRVRLLHDGEQCLGSMLDAIERAEREILLEMYWFGSDDTGRRFARALAKRAREGLRVLITYDAVGSFEAEGDMFEDMAAAGCGIYEWNPVYFWRPRFSFAGLNRRNHRKMLIVDGALGMTGGTNLGDLWAPASWGGHDFRDDMIQIEGPAVAAMRNIFLATFQGPGRKAALAEPLSALPSGSCPVRILANNTVRHRRLIERAYIEHIRAARRRILITNSYFLPSLRLRHLLGKAVARGVEVKVLLPVDSDVAAVAYATRYLYGSLMRRGIQLYEWGQSILHSKTAVIDSEWCTVGTHNLDHRSWAYNLEINVTVENTSVATQLEARMEQDLDASVRVDPAAWRFRPLTARALEFLFYRFRRLL